MTENLNNIGDLIDMKYNRVSIEVRPSVSLLDWTIFSNHHVDMTTRDFVEACGIIPDFFFQAIVETDTDDDLDNDDVTAMAKRMDDAYGFNAMGYVFKESKIMIDEQYVLRHPEDSDLRPYVMLGYHGSKVRCIIYPYGMVGLINDIGDQIIIRMD